MKTTERKSIKVIIADDHPLFRRGLKHALEETNDIEVIGEFTPRGGISIFPFAAKHGTKKKYKDIG